jgi:hypothetical protein
MINRGRVPLGLVARYIGLYLVLVGYSLAYEYIYQYQLTPLVHDDFTVFDPARTGIYTAIAFLTPLAILPIGVRLRAAGQFIVGALAVLLFIPIPIVFVPMPTTSEYWTIYALLWVGYFILCSLCSLSVTTRTAQFTDAGYKRLLTIVFAIVGLLLAYVVMTNHVQLVSLEGAHAAQADVTVKGLEGYILPAYICSFGGLIIAAAVAYRRYILIPLAVAGFLICYVTIEERTGAIMPFWIAFVFFSQKYLFRDSVARYLLCVMAPYLVLAAIAILLGTVDRQSIFYAVFMLADYRAYAIPAIAFNVYYNFFNFAPHTYWTHITLVSKFMPSPYDQPLSVVMENAYNMGNYNASFLETDGIAAAGMATLPWVCATFGIVLVAVNSCTRRLSVKMLALTMAGPAIQLMDVGLGPGFLTNGIGLLCIILLLAPRLPPWSEARRRLAPL